MTTPSSNVGADASRDEMTEHKSVPEWAWDRADVLTRGCDREGKGFYRTAFARYIAEHEEAPVDPLERAMAQANGVLRGEGNGTYDEALDALRDVLTALELAGERK